MRKFAFEITGDDREGVKAGKEEEYGGPGF